MIKKITGVLSLLVCYKDWQWYKSMDLRPDVFLLYFVRKMKKKYPSQLIPRNYVASLVMKNRAYEVNKNYNTAKEIYIDLFSKDIVKNGEAKVGEYYKVITANSPVKGKLYNCYYNTEFSNKNRTVARDWVQCRWLGNEYHFYGNRCLATHPHITKRGEAGNYFDNVNVGEVVIVDHILPKSNESVYDMISVGKNKYMVDCIRLVRATPDEIEKYEMDKYEKEITPTLRTLNHDQNI